MKVVTLFENRTISKDYKNKHGLSLYIEIANHKILFDTGTDDTFAKNASKLGVKLEDVDIAVISHGHYDHGGGLETFLKINNSAKIYIGKGAFDYHLVKLLGIIKYSIGINKKLENNDRLFFVDEMVRIDDELTVFGDVKGNKLLPKGNDRLLKRYNNGSINKDDFDHEINLIINENDKYSLLCGCAHNGIVNIIERAKLITKANANTVIGGFHLMGMDVKKLDTVNYLNELSMNLINSEVVKFYTCHCTGEQAYNYLREKMDNLSEIKTGMVIEV
jgi:7,8-dihydropterin-6-yl-methyl-4-(beta-D-ribofuranosyl)aminobenzene 5'-phosphate synthase